MHNVIVGRSLYRATFSTARGAVRDVNQNTVPSSWRVKICRGSRQQFERSGGERSMGPRMIAFFQTLLVGSASHFQELTSLSLAACLVKRKD